MLDALAKHWTLCTENGRGRRTYSVKAWGKDKPCRFTVERVLPIEAMSAAIDQLRGTTVKGLKLVGT